MNVYGFLAVPLILILATPFVAFCRRSAFWGRRKLSDRELQLAFNNYPRVLEALRLLSEFYEMPMGFLRPDDTFTKEGPLWKYDSWTFNEGQDKLNEFVQEKGLCGEHPDWTVLDFVQWYVETIQPSPEEMGKSCIK